MSVLISSSPPLPSIFTDLYQSNKLQSATELQGSPCVSKPTKPGLKFPDAPFRAKLSFVRKKAVVFADTVGLPLTQVKVVTSEETFPVTPLSFISPPSPSPAFLPGIRLNFSQPVTRPNFLNLIRQNHIGIENVVVNHFTLTGTILVHNLCFSKAVCIRSSRNYWLTHTDTSAEFLSSVAPDIDKFKFTLALPATLPPGARVEMCARLMAGGETFWDNNFSQNYQIKSVALPPSASSTLPLPPTVSAKHARAVGTKNARAVNAKHAPETVYY